MRVRLLVLALLVGCTASDLEPADVVFGAEQLALSSTPDWEGEPAVAGVHYAEALCGAGDVNGDGFEDLAIAAPSWGDSSGTGRVLVYFGQASGPATAPDQSLLSTALGESFGDWVDNAGDVNGDGFADLVVGAPDWSSDAGRVQVFHGSATGLSTTADWTVEWAQAGAGFGEAVASAGDVNGDGFSDVLVGAPGHDNSQAEEGLALLYLGSASGLGTPEDWSFEGDYEEGYVGISVDGAGDVNGDGYADVIVGGSEYSDTDWREGRAWVFHGSATGLDAVADWIADEDGPSARLGGSVAGVGDVDGDGYADVAVGASTWTGALTLQGAAFLYLGSASGLAPAPSWTTEGEQAEVTYGGRVGPLGDVDGDGYADMMVADSYVQTTQELEGKVYIYLGSASGPSTTPDDSRVSGVAGGYYGHGGVGSGDFDGDGFSDVLVGAHGYGGDFTGKASLFFGQADPPSETATWTVTSDQLGASLGYSVAGVGDVDGDGYHDVLVGAHERDLLEQDEGVAWLHHGSPTGASATPDWTGQGAHASAYYGLGLGPAGDVDGDGYDDVVIGAPEHDGTYAAGGAAWVHHGSSTGLEPTAGWTAEGDLPDSDFGIAAWTAGDVDGDGFDDLFVGAPTWQDSPAEEGRGHVYMGSPGGLEASPSWVLESELDGAWFGFSGGTSGDVDGDGYDDLVVGAPSYSNGQAAEGAAFLYLGSVSGLATTHAWMMESNKAEANCGFDVAGAGDVDGDGFDEVVVGCSHYDGPENAEGRAYLYAGSAYGLSAGATWYTEANQTWANLGTGVSSAGDVNGDGYGDVAIGAYSYDDGESNEGVVQVYAGSASGLDPAPFWSVGSDSNSALLGRTVSAADVNGDGLSDVISGSHEWASSGRAWIWLGGGADPPAGLGMAAHVRQSWAWVPVTPGTRTVDVDAFSIAALGRTAFGRGDVALEIEVKTAGVPFDGADTITSGLVDSGDPVGIAPTLVQGTSGLDPDTSYQWRARLVHDPAQARPQRHTRWHYGGRPGRPLSDHVRTACVDDTDADGQCDPVDLDDDDDGEPDGTDCDPLDPSVFPGAPEACDDVDSDCDGSIVDEYPDFDGDLDPDCNDPDDDDDGDPDDTDCDDLDPDFFTGAPEYCDPFDHDCDGSLADEFVDTDSDDDPDCTDPDDDGDGEPDTTDCDPLDPTVHPGAPEACDDIDSDCDGDLVDGLGDLDGDDLPDCIDGDADADGWPAALDCDDLDPAINPGAEDLCGDDVDSDCDGSLLDEFPDTDGDGDPDCVDTDDDGDDYPGDIDCDDLDAAVHPGATEACDDVDSDCDGSLVDELGDVDGDGLCDGMDDDIDGDGVPNGEDPDPDDPDADDDGTLDGEDCAPLDGAVHPGADELCDGLDGDCDGAPADDEVDLDEDGWMPCEGDCHDGDPAVHPEAEELCDAIDQDCDGDLAGAWDDTDSDGEADCVDTDDDGDGVTDEADCAPTDPAISPAAPEVCDDAVDNDCDGAIDFDDGSCLPAGCACDGADTGPRGSLLLLPLLLPLALLFRRQRR